MVEETTRIEIEQNPDPLTMKSSKALREREEHIEEKKIENKDPVLRTKLRDMVNSTVKEQISIALDKAKESNRPTTVVSKIIPEKDSGQVTVEQFFISPISVPQVGVRRSTSDADKLLFTFKDVVDTPHPIAKLMRMIMATYGVTQAEFDEKHRIYAESAGFLNTQVNYNRNNIKKAMARDRLSFQMFEQIILVIMQFRLNDMILKLVEPDTNNLVEFSLSGIMEKAQRDYTPDSPIKIETEDVTYVLPKE